MKFLSLRLLLLPFAVALSLPVLSTPSAAAIAPVVVAPSWNSPLGLMTSKRVCHTSTLLNSGKVLVVGGYNGSSELASAELYDPSTGLFTATGSLHSTRLNHTATLLPNGLVLVAGGQSTGQALATAELYNPATGVWTVTGSLKAARSYPTATPLRDGTILIVGGNANAAPPFFAQGASPSGALFSAELYDPGTGKWTLTASLHVARYVHTASLLPSGKVLVVGGLSQSVGVIPTSSAELYDPVAKTWTSTGSLAFASFDHALALLPNGQVLLAGGNSSTSGVLARAELYNPATGKWSATGNLTGPRSLPVANVLPNGKVLLAGGGVVAGSLATAELYDIATGTWTGTGIMKHPRSGHSAALLANGDVLEVGGIDGSVASGIRNTAELYTSALGSMTATTLTPGSRANYSATLLPNGKILFAGGDNLSLSLNTCVLFDPATGAVVSTGAMAEGRSLHTATLLTNGKVLVTGGANVLTSCELYDPATGLWTPTGSLQGWRSGHSATLLADGRVLVAGGLAARGTASCEIYDPTSGTWTLTGSLSSSSRPETILLPNGKVLAVNYSTSNHYVAQLYNPALGTWSDTGFPSGTSGMVLLPSGHVLQIITVYASGVQTKRAEIYNPETEKWTIVAGKSHMSVWYGKPAVLSNGKIFLTGELISGQGQWTGSEIFDPATGIWTQTLSSSTSSQGNRTILLPDGRVVILRQPKSTIDIFDPGLSPSPERQPLLDSTGVFNPAVVSNLTGAGFTGTWDDAAGSDIPVVQLRSLGNGQIATLPVNPAEGFDSQLFGALPITFPKGYALATVFVNGLPSLSQIASLGTQSSQSIQFTPVGVKTYGDGPFRVNAVSSTGLPVFLKLITGPAKLSDTNKITITGAGTIVVDAAQPGNGVYAPAYARQSIVVGKASQTVQFDPVTGVQYAGNSVVLSGSASTGFPVIFRLVSGPAHLDANLLTYTGAGPVVVEALQVGDADYLPSAPVAQTITVANKLSQSVIIWPLADKQATDPAFKVKVRASSGLPVTLTVTGPATVSGTVLTLTGGGLVTVVAHQAGNETYAAAPDFSRSFHSYSAQTITFKGIPDQAVGDSLTLTAKASSGLPVTLSVISGPATISGRVVTFTGHGQVKIGANQAGNEFFSPAPLVYRIVNVGPASQVVTLPAMADQVFNGPPITLNGFSSSGLPVSYMISGPAVLTGTTLQLTGAGKVTVTVRQAGNADYTAAPDVSLSFHSLKAPQEISFPAVAARPATSPPITLQATASSGLPIQYNVLDGPGTVEGNVLTLTGVGIITVQAVQAGNANYLSNSARIRVKAQ